MKNIDIQKFIAMLSIRLNKSKTSRGMSIFYLPEKEPKIYSVNSGIFLIKSFSTDKAIGFLMAGDSFYASPKFTMSLYLEELKPGVLTQIDLNVLFDYSSAKGLLPEVFTYLLELDQPELIYCLTSRSSAREEVDNLSKIYASRPEELKNKLSINAFIEKISFLSRGTIYKEIKNIKESKISKSIRE